MARVGVAITKQVAFRDSVQEFTNVYHYTWTGANPTEATALEIIDAIKAKEVPLHSTAVTFVRGKCWSAGGSISENQMLAQKLLTGTGSVTNDSGVDRERAILFQWPAGVDSRGKPVRLKKWYHSCGGPAAINVGGTIMGNTAGFSEAQRTTLEGLADDFHPIATSGLSLQLCAESGRETTGPVRCHKYFEHHQLGDMWRS